MTEQLQPFKDPNTGETVEISDQSKKIKDIQDSDKKDSEAAKDAKIADKQRSSEKGYKKAESA